MELLVVGLLVALLATGVAVLSFTGSARVGLSEAAALQEPDAPTAPLDASDSAPAPVNTAPPAAPVKLVFIHYSTGEAWLADGHGGLGVALRDNNCFVSDTNHGWGSALAASRGLPIGSTTDLGDWWTWFRSPSSPSYLAALYAESGQNCTYSRLSTDPGGPNEIVMFKSCFPTRY